jgi:hypothetical protein
MSGRAATQAAGNTIANGRHNPTRICLGRNLGIAANKALDRWNLNGRSHLTSPFWLQCKNSISIAGEVACNQSEQFPQAHIGALRYCTRANNHIATVVLDAEFVSRQ